MTEDLLAHAKRLESQFQFYVISLIFTLLAASVQTAKFGQSTFQDVTEVLAWFFLLGSGLLALSYAEWSPIIHRQLGTKREFSNNLKEAIALRNRTSTSALITRTHANTMSDEAILRDGEFVKELDEKARILGAKAQVKYNAAKYLFTAGLILIVASRSAATVVSIFGYQLI
jgi:hypothetical protein